MKQIKSEPQHHKTQQTTNNKQQKQQKQQKQKAMHFCWLWLHFTFWHFWRLF
jgi:hypothetical protein